MSTLTSSIKLNKLKKVAVAKIKGKKESLECVIIPVKENHIFVDKKQGLIVLDLQHNEVNNEYGSHIVKQNFPKEVWNAMSEEERKEIPILGNTKTWPAASEKEEEPEEVEDTSDEGGIPMDDDDDLPF